MSWYLSTNRALFSPQEALPIPGHEQQNPGKGCPILNPPPVPQDPALVPRKCPVVHKDDNNGVATIAGAPIPPAIASIANTANKPSHELTPAQRLRKALCSAGFASIITTMITGGLWQPIMTILVRQQFLASLKATPTAPTPAAGTTAATPPPTAQLSQAASNSFFNVGKNIAQEGKRIFFRGLTPRLMQSPLACVQWTAYEVFRDTLANRNESDLARFKYWLVFVMSRVLVTLVKCPFEVLKERMQVQGIVPNFHQLDKHSTTWQHFRYITQNEGFTALFRALPINICRDIPIAVLMMTGNDFFTHLYTNGSPAGFFDKYFTREKQARQAGSKPPSHISFLAGASAGLVATLVTQPIDVAKTIIQTQGLHLAAQQSAGNALADMPRRYTGLYDVLSTLKREKGVKAWFAGTPLRAAHLMVGGAIYLPLYRFVQQQLKFGFELPATQAIIPKNI